MIPVVRAAIATNTNMLSSPFAVPSHSFHPSIDDLSGICGSISIACWVVVFTPQIIENFRRSSVDGLSLRFLIIWLLGDVFNILGAVLQGVLPTMLILAVYYTFADVVLLGQCFYYRGFTLSDSPVKTIKSLPENDDGRITMIDEEAVEGEEEVTEQTYLLSPNQSKNNHQDPTLRQSSVSALLRLNSPDSQRDRRHSTISVVNLSPAVPFAPTPTPKQRNRRATLYQALFNFTALLLVCATGASGWWISNHYSHSSSSSTSPTRGHHGNGRRKEIEAHDILHFDISGQIFGYLCALLYLGSRIPQILLNFRRKSTEGVSMLFFLFACVGNLTYVFSVMVYEPTCALTRRRSGCGDGEWQEQYTQYILVNLSWLIGSAGTLALDLGIFVQFWMYRGRVAGIS